MAPAALAAAERPHLVVAQRRTPTRCHGGDRWHATTTAAPLACRHHSTSHRALRSARGAGPTCQRDRSRPPSALGADAVTPSDSRAAAAVPFFECFNNCGRTDVQHPCSIANATGIHRHVDYLLLDGRRLPGIGIFQEKRAPTLRARATPIALLAFRRGAMFDNIGPVAVGAVQDVSDHDGSLSYMGCCSA